MVSVVLNSTITKIYCYTNMSQIREGYGLSSVNPLWLALINTLNVKWITAERVTASSVSNNNVVQ